jgi:hypothetical protein
LKNAISFEIIYDKVGRLQKCAINLTEYAPTGGDLWLPKKELLKELYKRCKPTEHSLIVLIVQMVLLFIFTQFFLFCVIRLLWFWMQVDAATKKYGYTFIINARVDPNLKIFWR